MKKVNLYADVLAAGGYNRSLLLDSLKGRIHFIGNDIFDQMNKYDFKNIPPDVIEPLFREYLVENDLIFDVTPDLAGSFPLMDLNWDFPFEISNAVVHVTKQNCEFLKNIRESHFISHFNFIFDDSIDSKSLNQLFDFIQNHSCDSIELTFVRLITHDLKEELESLIAATKKIIGFNNYAGIELTNLVEWEEQKFNRQIVDLNRLYNQLSRNLEHYAEAQSHHTYFNRKLFIDKTGEIKNAPECTQVFGNLSQIYSPGDLSKIIQNPDFKKYWSVRKDHTDVCKECEFRYLCTDNRLPLERNGGEWYHAAECGYNPYVSKWDNEEGYRTLSECGVTSNEHGFSINKERIKEINQVLWFEETESE